LRFPPELPRDEEAANDKEDINTNESTWGPRETSVKEEHEQDRDAAETLNI
jgi:hypothetical protein